MGSGVGKKERRLAVLCIFVGVAVLGGLISGFVFVQKKTVKQFEEEAVLIGQYDLQDVAKKLNDFIHQGVDLLESRAFVIDHMVSNGAQPEEIQDYLARESRNFSEILGSKEGGYFGYIGNVFYHGAGWQPSVGYIPTRRPWYVEAARSRGRAVLSAPFASARNLGGIISVNKRLSQKSDVLALGFPLTNLNAVVNANRNNADDIWFIMDRDGLVVGSSGEIRSGFNCRSSEAWGTEEEKLSSEVLMSVGTPFDFVFREKKVKVFTASIQDSWILVQMTDEATLFKGIQENVFMSSVVFDASIVLVVLLIVVVFISRMQVIRIIQGRSDFLDDVGFEIRTSVNGILGMVRILFRDVRDEFQQDCVKSIELSTRGILSVVDDMREVAKIERGNMDLDASEYEVFSLLKDCFDAASPKATAKNLHFSMECDPDLPTSLWGDFARIRQIISNLISNAISYTEVGEVKVSVGYDVLPDQTDNKLDEKINLKITIKDTGIGVRDKESGDFFGSFDLGAVVNRKMRGTSFGLGLTKRLVSICGGDFMVKSRYGEGTTYMITIPQMVLNIEPMGDFALRYRKSASMKGAESEMIYAPNARILVVDDVEMNLKVVRGLLRDTRVQIDVAKNGSQCLSMVELKHYDLIFLDNLMPVMDGMETFERMKRMHNSPNNGTPVVLMTSIMITTDKGSYTDAGFADFVQKPLKEEDLLRALKWYLPRHLILTSEDRKESPNIALYSKVLDSQDSKNTLVQKPVDLNSVGAPVIERQRIDDLELDMVTSPKPGESLQILESFLNVKSGMEYCVNDESFYKEMLVEYVSANKYEDVCSALASGDWTNYQIMVHGLKGTSLTIGADDLSGELKSLEMACKENRREFVIENNGRVMEMYAILIEKIKKGLNIE